MRPNTRAAEKELVALCRQYHAGVPLLAISQALEASAIAIAEPDFILCGEEGRTTLALAQITHTPLDTLGTLSVREETSLETQLAVQWYRMPSGRYEVNAYFT